VLPDGISTKKDLFYFIQTFTNSTMSTILDSLGITIKVSQGRKLVAKDRSFGLVGRKSSSDPYCRIYLRQNAGKLEHLGDTQVVRKSLSPVWNSKFKKDFNYHQVAMLFHQRSAAVWIVIYLYDQDENSQDDPMGTVEIPLDLHQDDSPRWYTVGKGSGANFCRNATGEIEVAVEKLASKLLRLSPGHSHPISASSIGIGLAWQLENGQSVDMDAACVCIDNTGNVDLLNTVYYGNLQNRNNSIVHTGDERTGEKSNDDETISVDLDRIPAHILCMYIILSVSTPDKTLAQVRSAQIRFYHRTTTQQQKGICGLVPADFGNATSLIVARIARNQQQNNTWMLNPIEEGVAPDRDFGTLIPSLKSYTRDLLPSIRIDPTEIVAIMRKNGVIRLRDFCPGHVVPEKVSFGLAWDITNEKCIDLDASAICLDENLQQMDMVYFKHLSSNDGAIVHSGDERRGASKGDDETINILLCAVDPRVKFIGFVVNSYSGEELDDVALASCHLYDTATGRDIARYALSNSHELDKHTALVMGCLLREGSDWQLHIISEAAQGRTVHDNVDELQNFLRLHPVPPPLAVEENEEEIDLSMPTVVPHDEDEIVVVPASELMEEDIVLPPR
jgi:tellurium resistance protein TerZ